MKRKIYDNLVKWKNEEQGAVALLVEGARRIGKSYIVEEFAKKEYKSYILVDFVHISILVFILLLSSIPCFAQRVEYDFNKDEFRYIYTASTAVLTPNNSHFPISISLDYYGNENVKQYYLSLYGRYELTKNTKIDLILADSSEMQFEAYASNIYHSRLGLIKMTTIYDALYIISNEQLSNILNIPIVGVKIKTGDDWHCKTFKRNKIGEWLKLNYREINKRLNKG